MKKICFIHPSSELYGADRILIYVMKNYSDFKKVLILRSQGPLVALVQKELPDVEIKIISTLPIIAKKYLSLAGIFNFLIFLVSFLTKIKKIKKEKFDVVYLNTLAVLPIIFYFSKNSKKIIHIHEILKNDSLFHRIINKIALVKSDFLVCVSKAVKKNMEFASNSNKEKLKLIYNGINFNKTETEHLPFEINKSKTNFALIGRIKPSHKGQNLLVDAISKLNKKSLDSSHFYLVGSTVKGQEYMLIELKNKIQRLKLENNITIIPFVKNIELVYENIDVVIVPSVFDDPFPTTVLEAMFFSKPVIGTDVGGIPEMILNNKTGFIVKRNCANELSQRIDYFLINKNKIIEFGEQGHIRFLSNYSKKSFDINYRSFIKKYILKSYLLTL